MNIFSDQIPIWISIAFLVAILFPVFMIANLVRQTDQKRYAPYIIGFYILYLIGVSLACFNGAFDVVSLPPRIILITTLPLLLFYLIFIFNTRTYKKVLSQLRLSSLVGVHIFRLIGSFFLILMSLQLLPKPFAFIAGLGDIVTAITSLFVAKAIIQKRSYAKRLTWIWNTFGFLDILVTSATAVLLTKWNIETGSMGVDVLTVFPFCFIPAFAPATIIFLHISIYRKLLRDEIS